MKEWDDSIVDFAAPQDGFLTRSFGGRSGPLMLDNGAPITFPWQSQQEIAGTAPSTIVSYDDTGVGFTALSLEGPTMVAGANRAYLDLRGRSAGGAQLIMGDGSALNFVAINDDQVNISSTGSGLILNNADLTIVGDDTIWIHNNLTTGTTVDVESNAALNLIGVPVNINGVDVSTGLGAWTPYSPTLGQPGSVTYTATYAHYRKQGRMVTVSLYLNVTGTGNASTKVTVSLPFTAVQAGFLTVGTGHISEGSPSGSYPARVVLDSTTTAAFQPTNVTTGNFLGVVQFANAITSGDVIDCTFTYEATT